MASIYRVCGGADGFNSGSSSCPIPRGKIKGLIFVHRGRSISDAIGGITGIETAAHADRPNRIYPVKVIDEYAPSGGEAQTSQQGYGSSKVTSYSAKVDAFTIDKYDMGLKKHVVEAKDAQFDVFLINDSNVIFGERGDNGAFKGIPLSGIYAGGQDYDSSGQVANLIINIMYADIEKHWKLEDTRVLDFDILSAMYGLVDVQVVKVGESNYKIIEKYGRLDLTPVYGELIVTKKANVVTNPTAVTSYANGVIVATGIFNLVRPSTLYANGISGIEQVDRV
jgi:hypothetical protein